MNKIEYVYYFSSEMTDRLRVTAVKERGQILKFCVQYEGEISNRWHPIVRYNTAHGYAHRDVIHPDGTVDKMPLYFVNYNLAFTYATQDLKRFWRNYKENFQKEVHR